MTIEEGNILIAQFDSAGYSISAYGEVQNKHRRLLKLYPGTSGYLQVNFYSEGKQRTLLVHRLVAIKFLLNPNNCPEVNHKDGNKRNNCIFNLEWVTRSENILHGFSNGLISKSMIGRIGKKHWRSKPILQILNREIIAEFECARDVERKLGFSNKAVFDACSGKLKSYKGFQWKYKNENSSTVQS